MAVTIKTNGAIVRDARHVSADAATGGLGGIVAGWEAVGVGLGTRVAASGSAGNVAQMQDAESVEGDS
ncbi:MAG TPA: hypothetical protein DHW63_08410 [Hyphomonadaceae bacterium]|nr:hypothetical protein [Hyphomonadaceae bacterium]